MDPNIYMLLFNITCCYKPLKGSLGIFFLIASVFNPNEQIQRRVSKEFDLPKHSSCAD